MDLSEVLISLQHKPSLNIVKTKTTLFSSEINIIWYLYNDTGQRMNATESECHRE